MRFAVHRPGIPEASPRSHGVSGRDVPGRVHIRLAGDRVYVMRRVRVEISGAPGELAGRLSEIEDSYLGRSSARGSGQ